MTATALRGLSRFAEARGVPPSGEFLLDYDVIEAFCVAGLPGRVSSTRGTYRSALYRLAEAAHGPPGQRATPFAGARAPAPYYRRSGQSWPWSPHRNVTRPGAPRRWRWWYSASAPGCGRVSWWRCAAVMSHGTAARYWFISRLAARVVPVTSWYAGRAAELARRAGSGHVFRPGPADRSYKNFVTNFARGLAADPAAPPLTAGPARATFICGHLAAGTPVPVLLAVTGIAEAGSLARYARHVRGIGSSKGALRARWRAERTP